MGIRDKKNEDCTVIFISFCLMLAGVGLVVFFVQSAIRANSKQQTIYTSIMAAEKATREARSTSEIREIIVATLYKKEVVIEDSGMINGHGGFWGAALGTLVAPVVGTIAGGILGAASHRKEECVVIAMVDGKLVSEFAASGDKCQGLPRSHPIRKIILDKKTTFELL